MKINYKNTALGLLDKMDPYQFRMIDDVGETTIEEKRKLAISIVRIWPNILPRFKKKIQYVSDPFYQAFHKGAHKMVSVLDKEDIDESGVFIHKASVSETNTVFYSIKTWGQNSEYEMDATVLIFNSQSGKEKPSLVIVAQRRPGMPVGGMRFYAARAARSAGITPISVLADILTMVLFLKYCDLETKEIKPSKREMHIGIKYVNDTTHNIEVLDSTWFTTISRTEGFGVRGHFRFQPYGPGNSMRRLQWIDAFEKEGYTRTAKILNQ